jgi:hypothetical protein
MPGLRVAGHDIVHGANALAVRCRIGVSSGKF